MLAATPTVRLARAGDKPLFEVLVAEVAGGVAGYASFQPFYDSDLAEMGVWLIDLNVDPAARSGGLGRLLMAELARLVQARGGRSLTWGVLNGNCGAIKFYQELGALDAEARILELKGDALAAVAARS
ncbi:MAG: GNAT family N-acetyltransferase [Kiloniellales bacterium]